MRQWILGLVIAVSLAANVGCFIPIYSGDPAVRTKQLIFTSENFRQITEEWERIWFLDQPSHLTPHRVHGGVI